MLGVDTADASEVDLKVVSALIELFTLSVVLVVLGAVKKKLLCELLVVA